MPRQNRERSVGCERNVARRVKLERERTGMTFESLAKRMADAGCPIQLSALHRIEKGDPPRRITVDELVAFAAAFRVTPSELLRDPRGLFSARVAALAERRSVEEARRDAAQASFDAAEQALFEAVGEWLAMDGSDDMTAEQVVSEIDQLLAEHPRSAESTAGTSRIRADLEKRIAAIRQEAGK